MASVIPAPLGGKDHTIHALCLVDCAQTVHGVELPGLATHRSLHITSIETRGSDARLL
jgi:hypothetical protein